MLVTEHRLLNIDLCRLSVLHRQADIGLCPILFLPVALGMHDQAKSPSVWERLAADLTEAPDLLATISLPHMEVVVDALQMWQLRVRMRMLVDA